MQFKDKKKKLKAIDDYLQIGVEEGVFPGANYGFIINGERFFGSAGWRAIVPKKEVNSKDTIYDIASLTKVVATTTAILKLAEVKRLSLQDRVNQYLDFIKEPYTINDLLTHSSGLPALTGGDTVKMTRLEPLLKELYHCPIEYKTGQKVIYSDVGFMYLGFILDKLTGGIAQYLYKNVFIPLEMTDTTYNHREIMRIAPTEKYGFRGMIRGFVHDEKAFLLNGIAGHAGLYSTVNDLVNYMEMILNNGCYKQKRILNEHAISCLFKKVIKDDDGDHRSIGWKIKRYCKTDVLYHTGFTGTHMIIDKTHQYGFVLLSNRVHPTRENIKIIEYRKGLEKLLNAFL